jgi:hypothetical protein
MKSLQQLKEELHSKIENIDDESALQMLNEDIVPYIVNRSKGENAEEDNLTSAELEELEEAIKEADNGETISFEQFKERMDTWRSAYKSTKDLK